MAYEVMAGLENLIYMRYWQNRPAIIYYLYLGNTKLQAGAGAFTFLLQYHTNIEILSMSVLFFTKL